MNYNDQYDTCDSTFATFRVYHADLIPKEIDNLMGIQATSGIKRGDPISPKHPKKGVKLLGAWFLESKDYVDSKDSRRHIDWLLAQIKNKTTVLRELRAKGYEIDISCYWCSANGHGGPVISPKQTRLLADLDLELWFDFYFPRA